MVGLVKSTLAVHPNPTDMKVIESNIGGVSEFSQIITQLKVRDSGPLLAKYLSLTVKSKGFNVKLPHLVDVQDPNQGIQKFFKTSRNKTIEADLCNNVELPDTYTKDKLIALDGSCDELNVFIEACKMSAKSVTKSTQLGQGGDTQLYHFVPIVTII